MGSDLFDDDPGGETFDRLAEEFTRRHRRGEQPSIEDYAARHPELATTIRLLFPAVALLESGRGDRDDEDLAPPFERLGENRILREIGRGGMGIVYEAEQDRIGRRVAVKVLPPHAGLDSLARKRFLIEARAVARLQHPNIVPIFAMGEESGIAYIVMALIDGSGLDQGVREPGMIGHRRAADLIRQAAEALAFAHAKGVLHRDVKPSNLLLDRAGTLWLADFGLAKLADDCSLTRTGDHPGTLRYLAPESLAGRADARGDVYSLGLTLYELLLGRPAFTETQLAPLLRQIHEDEPETPRRVDPSIPRDLETITLKAMARDPDDRYQTAEEMAEDLRLFLDGRAIVARPPTPLERLTRWVRRNPLVAGLIAVSLVLAMLTAYFVGLFLFAPPPGRPPRAESLDGRPPGPEFRRPPGPPPIRRDVPPRRPRPGI